MEQRHEALFKQLEGFRGYLLKVSDVTEEEAEFIPEGFQNNIRWNLGHIFTEQYSWIETLTKEPIAMPKQFSEWFGWGTSPSHFVSKTPSLKEVRLLLKDQFSCMKETYGDRLEEEFPPTEMWGMTTIEQVLRWTTFHEGMHLQRILDIKKLS